MSDNDLNEVEDKFANLLNDNVNKNEELSSQNTELNKSFEYKSKFNKMHHTFRSQYEPLIRN